MAIYPNFYQTLLPCPIVELRGYLAACGLRGRLYAYLDYYNNQRIKEKPKGLPPAIHRQHPLSPA